MGPEERANLPEVSTAALSPTAQAGPLTHDVSTQICIEKCLRYKGLQALAQGGVSDSSATLLCAASREHGRAF